MAGRFYSPDRKAEVLAAYDANGGNVKRTCGETGVPEGTLRYWLKKRDTLFDGEDTDLEAQKHGELDDYWSRIAERAGLLSSQLLEDMSRQDLEDKHLMPLVKTLAIATDKLLLLRGEPTERVDYLGTPPIREVRVHVSDSE